MNPSAPFIRRPIATSLVMMAIAVFGALAYHALPVSDVPDVAYPSLNVTVSLPGADPATMASSVAAPLERQFTTIAGLDSMNSSSAVGTTTVTLQFDLSRDIDSAAVDVQTAIAAVMPLLPPALPAPPTFRKTNPADDPVINLALTSRTMSMSEVDRYAETMLAPSLSMVPGVAQVDVNGAQKYAVRVQVDPERLTATAISLNDIDQALQSWNVNLPVGQLFGRTSTYTLVTNGQLADAAAFRKLIVAYRGGAPLRLEQVAAVTDSVENNRSLSWFYTKTAGAQRAIILGVRRQMSSNMIDMVDAVRRLLPSFRANLPPGIHLTVSGDRSVTVREAFNDVRATLVAALELVVGVIYLFLGSGRATAIPSLALPFSILGTFAAMWALQFTLDNLSMMALILSVGFVVDDAIVVLENIVRHLEAGVPRLEAALRGSGEVAFTIVSMTVSLAAAFIPILFMNGVLGRVFREFAMTITVAILISGFVSITLTPMLCSRFLERESLRRRGMSLLLDRGFEATRRAYARSLAAALRHPAMMVILFGTVLAATVEMYGAVPKGFVPEQDADTLTVNLRAAQGTSPEEMVRNSLAASDVINRSSAVEALTVTSGGNAMNTGRIQIQLTPRGTRPSASQVAQQLRRGLAPLVGARAFVTVPAALTIGSRMTNSSYVLTVQALDTTALYTWAPRLEQVMAARPELQDVSNDLEIKSPRVDLIIDRDKAATIGLNATQIENALYDGFGQKWSTTIYGNTAQYRVLLELDPTYQARLDLLNRIFFKSASGRLVPLEAVARFAETVGPQTINHTGQLPAVALSFALRPGASLGAAVDEIAAAAERLLPRTMITRFEGSAKLFQSSLGNLGLLLIVAIGTVYIVLGILYESYMQPLTLLSGLPSAGLGALVTLWLFKSELNVYSFVGLIMLVGIVKKNAIMQIDVALDAERHRNKSPAEAIYDACLLRYRPIMMTTVAALAGAVPIALGLGAGGEARRPLGLAVVGGLIASQLITLYLTPVVYTWFARLGRGETRRVLAETYHARHRGPGRNTRTC